MPELIHDSEGKPFLVSGTVSRWMDEHGVTEEQLLDLATRLMWHDVHTSAVDALAKSDLHTETTTDGHEAGWLLHEIAREVRAA
jgi:hypothetical protein